MAKPELGTKRICPVTGRKFYDLNKDPVVSPFTGESYPRSYFEPAVRGRAEPRSVAEEPEAEEAEAEVISLEEADEEAAGPTVATTGEEVDDDIEAADDDTFLEEDEDDGDDVSDLIGEGLEDDEEA
ncbi:TIGR02300 family protein [Xanthobacter sp. KR7-225]|uniref:TIGR02300 family protein n=1 Tax=Xanthobacter sp. KR7-225 TaxID=3156613 RepID=UPI0032B3E94E